jgi:hypothetical protein
MKRLLPLLFLLFSLTTIGQDYSCIIPTDTSYFINADGYLRGIRIDSVRTIGSEIVYYPFKTRRDFSTTVDNSNGCWLGSRIVKQANGIFRFHTYWLDTIFVNAQAMPGDSWSFYNDATSRHYLAKVVSIDTITIEGTIDSVKKIQIEAYLGSTLNISDPVHGFEILLSKNRGFASTFDLYTFPYFSLSGTPYYDVFSEEIGLINQRNYTFRQVEFHVPTLLELLDYNIGDVFITASGSVNASQNHYFLRYDSIISKSIINAHEIEYKSYNKTRRRSDYYYYPSTQEYQEDTISIWIDTTKAFDFPSMPEELPDGQTVWHYNPNDTSNCGTGKLYSREFVIVFEGCENYESYKTGFPTLTYKDYWDGSTPWWEECANTWKELRYSVKSGVQCGTRVDVLPISVNEIPNDQFSFCLYPNPASETIHIKAIPESTDIFISDITGRQIISTHTATKKTSIDISQLAPGPYIIRVNDARQTFIKQ